MTNIVDERGYNQIFRSSPTQSIRIRRRADAMITEMHLPKSLEERKHIHILEIGCGLGEMAHYIAERTGAKVTGVDLSSRFIEQARALHVQPGLRFAVVDLSNSSPASVADRYDYIVGNGILHHLYHHLDLFLPVLERWLAPKGKLIFWEPNLWNPYVFFIFSIPVLRRLAKLEPDEMAFTANFIAQKLSRCGFKPIKVCPRDFLLPNTPAFLIKPVTGLGDWLERIPFISRLAQSVYLVAERSEN